MTDKKTIMTECRTAIEDAERIINESETTAKDAYDSLPPDVVTKMNKLAEMSKMVFVISDVHLGIEGSKKDNFYQQLDNVQIKGQTIILLGDILDFWIYTKYDNNQMDELVEKVIEEWNELWKKLSELKNRGINIHYVPGNHDAFMFFIEAEDKIEFCKTVMAQLPQFEKIRSATNRIKDVASIHYPYYQREIGEKKFLFTHGHYRRWLWKIMTGIYDEYITPEIFLHLTIASVAFAHKYARRLRQENNIKNNIKEILNAEDMAISITNSVLRASEEARKALVSNPAIALDIIDQAIKEYFNFVDKEATTKTEQDIRLALKQLIEMQGENMSKDMKEIRSKNIEFLKETRGSSFHIEVTNGELTKTTFYDFVNPEPDQFIFGHYHNPRDIENAHDTGGFVDEIITSINIKSDGTTYR